MRKDPPTPFTSNDDSTMQLFANHVSPSIEQIIASHASSDEKSLAAIDQIIRSTSTATNIPALLVITLQELMSALQVTKGLISIEQSMHSKGMPLNAHTILFDNLQAQEIPYNQTIHISEWARYEGPLLYLLPRMKKLNVQSNLLIPIQINQKTTGYIFLGSPKPHTWQLWEIYLSQIVAKQLALFVEKLQHTQNMAHLESMIHRFTILGQKFNQLFTFQHTVQIIGETATSLLRANHAAVFLLKNQVEIESPWYYALPGNFLDQLHSISLDEFIHYLLNISMPDILDENDASRISPLFKSAVFLPLIYEQQIIGCIACFYDMPQTWNTTENEIMAVFANQVAVVLQNSWIYEQMENSYIEIALTLAKTADRSKKDNLSDHSKQVAKLTQKIARVMGCNDEQIQDIYWAALLHEIGKSSIPDNILQKSGALSEEEWKIIENHPMQAEAFIRPLGRFQNVSSIIRSCREHYNGGGYPDGLIGKDIPLGARILAVVDAYVSMLENRPHQASLSHQEAVNEIKRCSGKQFDPIIVNTFMNILPSIKPTHK